MVKINLAPTVEENYNFDIWATSIDTISDTMSGSFEVTNNVYARDNGNDISEHGLGRSCGGMVIGNYFDIYIYWMFHHYQYMSKITLFQAKFFRAMYEIDFSLMIKIYLVPIR